MLIWPFIECNTSGLCPGVHQEDSKGVPPLVVCGVHTPLDEIHLENIFLI